ncbi:Hsp20/alpha crystallin family protein [Paraburkholderia aspalathi]|nr:Hsp20/alpha crystallin family protein [Paraburkholderia aspalathi]
MSDTSSKLPVSKSSTPETQQHGLSPFLNFRREIDRLLDEYHPYLWDVPSRAVASVMVNSFPSKWDIVPSIDVSETETEYKITVELPGLDEKDVDINLSNHTLTIKGEKSEVKEDKGKGYHVSERKYGSFQRIVKLPDGVDIDNISAKFSKGVLTVTMPKTAEAQQAVRKIDVKRGD